MPRSIGGVELLGADGASLVLYLVILFFRQIDRLLGSGVLVKVMLGRYHRPRRERRVFMFIDLKSSTSIAEIVYNGDVLNTASRIQAMCKELGPVTLRGKAEPLELVGLA